MTAEPRTPTATIRAGLRRWWSSEGRLQPAARPSRPLPLYEALAIGLGCNIANLERSIRDADAGTDPDVR